MQRLLLGLILLWQVGFGIEARGEEVSAADSLSVVEASAEHEAGKFDPGAFIIEHVLDAYEWHIFTWGDTHVSLPLPILVYSKHSGFHCFMSSKFHHGHETYEGLRIAGKDEENKGKIVEEVSAGVWERPTFDFSLTKNALALLVSVTLLLLIFLNVAKAYVKFGTKQGPRGLQSWVEPVILFVRDDVAKPAIGAKYERFMPYLLTLFFFILINNLMGLIPILPGGANVTGNTAITLVLALITFIITTCCGNKHYWVDIVNTPGVPWWLKFPAPLMPIIELMGMFTKPIVLMIRLFANITAGHIIVIAFFSLIFIFGEMSVGLGYGVSVATLVFTVFMSFLELLVAFIQAYVFTLLSALYIGMAVAEPHHAEH